MESKLARFCWTTTSMVFHRSAFSFITLILEVSGTSVRDGSQTGTPVLTLLADKANYPGNALQLVIFLSQKQEENLAMNLTRFISEPEIWRAKNDKQWENHNGLDFPHGFRILLPAQSATWKLGNKINGLWIVQVLLFSVTYRHKIHVSFFW